MWTGDYHSKFGTWNLEYKFWTVRLTKIYWSGKLTAEGIVWLRYVKK